MKKISNGFMLLLIVLSLAGCELEPPTENQVILTLNGDDIIELALGDEFVDLGAIATIEEIDFTSSITVEGSVDTSIAGVYVLEYELNYSDNLYTLNRYVIVTNPNLSSFQLIGDVIVEHAIGEEYIDEGFIALEGNTDISSFVTVFEDVDVNTSGIYLIEYTLTYDDVETILLRAVVVNSSYLYNGVCENVEIHFIDLDAMGDSTLIDCGDYEILIDAGTPSVGENLVVPYIETYVTDGIIELVIATHPDYDHFGGFIDDGVFGSFEIEEILESGYFKDTIVYGDFVAARDLTGAKVCTGLKALNSVDGCQPVYQITKDLSLTVIDTGNYDGLDSNHNENSIVVLLEHKDLKYLFTGDAEFDAEAHMAQFLMEVDVFKAGHHGSKTANSATLLDVILPTDIILSVHFPEDDGENQYYIPQQEALDRMFLYTDNLYATGTNGHIVIESNGTTYTITGSLNSTLLKDTDWFSTYRTYPVG